METITTEEAEARGLWPMTKALLEYDASIERMVADLRKSWIACAVIALPHGRCEVWRGGKRLDHLAKYKDDVKSRARYNLSHAPYK